MYFCLFMVIGSLITLNLFITVVLENFNEQQNHDLAQEVLADFKEKWTAYDKKCVGWLTVESFLDLLRETDPPIGLYRPDSAAEMVRHLRFLGIPISKDGKLRYVKGKRDSPDPDSEEVLKQSTQITHTHPTGTSTPCFRSAKSCSTWVKTICR